MKTNPDAVLGEVNEIIAWFHDNYNTQDIDTLLHQQNKLSTLAYWLSVLASKSKQRALLAKTHRRIEVYKKKDSLVSDGMSGVKAEIQSEAALGDLYMDEAVLQNTADHYKILIDHIIEVLASMRQYASYLKQEKGMRNE